MCPSFLLLFFFILSFSLGFGHFEGQDVANPVQCFSRCVAKCLVDHLDFGLNECQTNCRQYGQHNLCTNNLECWKRCKDLGVDGGPPKPPPPPPRELEAKINENFTIDVKWKPGPGPEGEKSSLFLVEIQAESPNHQTTQILAQGLEYSGLSPSSPENICGPITVRVATINAVKGVGHFSKPVQIPVKAPQIPAHLELISTKFNSTPYVKDEYKSNGTLNVELEFKYNNGWPFGVEDLEVNPIFHLIACANPDLHFAVPFPDFGRGTKPNRIMANLGADMMYRRCRFVYVVDQIRSNKCAREYSSVAGKDDYESVEFRCKIVEGADLLEFCAGQMDYKSNGPVCGFYFNHFNYTIEEEKIESKTKEKRVSVSITFDPIERLRERGPKYYVAIYGNAKRNGNRDEVLGEMVNMTDVIGQQTSCAEFSEDGCKRFNANSKNLITLHDLKLHTEYGVVICAIMDPKNLTLPVVISADKFAKPYAYSMFLHRKGHRGEDSYESGEEEEEEEENGKGKKMEHKRNIIPYMVLAIVVLLAMLLVAIVAIFCWIRRQKDQLKKKRLNLEAMRRGREQRYTDFPSRREDPWELERRNLIIYEDKKLGAGAFGSVYLGKLVGINRLKNDGNNLSIGLLRAENALVAVKMLPEYADDLSKSEFLREIGLMKTLGYHERLVNMLACVTQSEPYCLVVEYCSDGDLLQFLRHRCKYMLELDDAGVPYSDPECDAEFDHSMIMTVKQLLMFSVQISYGLEYLSQKGFVHRDVAARNILVNEKTHAKIGDFGLCRFIYADSSNYKGRGGRLPIKWMSPEAIRHYEFTTSSDVWSFGILMFEIITLGGTPYPGIQPDDMLAFLESGNRIPQPDNCPNEYYKIMCSCWTADHRMRPDFGAIRQQLALQLENVSDEYAYLKLDAKKDYYNVSYGELKAQRGEDLEEIDENGIGEKEGENVEGKEEESRREESAMKEGMGKEKELLVEISA